MIYVSDFTNVLLIICTLGTCTTLVLVTLICICGCRRETPKDDLLGVDGMVKITNPDENVNHLQAKNVTQDFVDGNNSDTDINSKRSQNASNHQRRLPDIPCTEIEIKNADNGVLGDVSSELYATVDDKTLAFKETETKSKRLTFLNGIDSRESASQNSSISQSDSNYSSLRENPYDKVKKAENPYSKVQIDEQEEVSDGPEETASHWNETDGHSSSDAVVDPITLRVQNGNSSQSLHNGSTSTAEIAAATAIAGRISASVELPYMTPPLQQPQYFSGDSQDSSKGYTSITVREPLANIMQQTPYIPNKRSHLDPHYSTVSDDSDEMYAAIVEPNNQIYTSGSETYAQIQPITVAEVHGCPPGINPEHSGVEPAPQPPSVDSLKHVAHVHSRQASSSSCTSSVANLGSPKPEKRQANSPLPPPPLSVSPDIYNRIDKIYEADNLKTPNVQNLEDMYAKVFKTKKKVDEDSNSSILSSSDNIKSHNVFESKKRKSICSGGSFDEIRNSESVSLYSSDSDIIDFSSTIQRNQEHCYETLNKNKRPSLNECDIGYERIRNASGSNSLINSDPGYEQVNNPNKTFSVFANDPNYEVLHSESDSSTNNRSLEDKYSVIDKKKKTKYKTENIEPNYESVPNEVNNIYATVQPSCGSEHNYESVHYLNTNLSEPPYESLNCDIHDSDSVEVRIDNTRDLHDKVDETNMNVLDPGKNLVSDTSETVVNMNVEDIEQNNEELMYFQV